jgi:hypothetical protein
MTVNNEYKGAWREADMALCQEISWYLPATIEETSQDFGVDSLYQLTHCSGAVLHSG